MARLMSFFHRGRNIAPNLRLRHSDISGFDSDPNPATQSKEIQDLKHRLRHDGSGPDDSWDLYQALSSFSRNAGFTIKRTGVFVSRGSPLKEKGLLLEVDSDSDLVYSIIVDADTHPKGVEGCQGWSMLQDEHATSFSFKDILFTFMTPEEIES